MNRPHISRACGALVSVAWMLAAAPMAALAQQPAVTSLVPASASTTVVVRVTGTGFGTTSATNEVTFVPPAGTPVAGVVTGVAAANSTGTLTRISVRVPDGLPVGRTQLLVRNTSTGLTSAPAVLEIVAISPAVASASPGVTVDVPVSVEGNSTFESSTIRATFGAGITVNRVALQSARLLVANITTSPSAVTGPRTVTVTTTTMTAVATNAFQVVSSQTNSPPTPVIGGDTAGTAGQPIALNAIGSTDPDNDALTFAWDFGDGTPGAGPQVTRTYPQAGSFTVTLTVTDGRGGSARATRAITIEAGAPSNGPPQITSQPPTIAPVGRAYEYQVVAIDPDNDTLTYSLTTAPAGMQVSPAGRITWTPTASQQGTRDVAVEVTDTANNTAPQAFSVVVAPPPALQSLSVVPTAIDFTATVATRQLTVTGEFTDGTSLDLTAASAGTTYESDNANVASVSAGGLVTAVADGSATITARNSGKNATAQVTVAIPAVVDCARDHAPASPRCAPWARPFSSRSPGSSPTAARAISRPRPAWPTSPPRRAWFRCRPAASPRQLPPAEPRHRSPWWPRRAVGHRRGASTRAPGSRAVRCSTIARACRSPAPPSPCCWRVAHSRWRRRRRPRTTGAATSSRWPAARPSCGSRRPGSRPWIARWTPPARWRLHRRRSSHASSTPATRPPSSPRCWTRGSRHATPRRCEFSPSSAGARAMPQARSRWTCRRAVSQPTPISR